LDEANATAAVRERFSWTGLAVGGAAAVLARDLDLATLTSYWGSRSPLMVGVALAFALLWPTRLRKALAAATAALAVAWCVVAFTPLTPWLARELPRRDAPRPADAVFVLGTRLQEDGEFTTQSLTRLVRALELVGQGFTGRVIVSELPPPYTQYAPAARALIASLRLDAEVLAVGPVRTTRDEARLVAGLARERGMQRLILVTDPLHSRRAGAAFEAEGLEIVSVPSIETRYDLERLDRPDERLASFGALLHEYAGAAYYRLRGWAR
jgi:uncharacterized SAM-binding protein YcdF (DUF218 family)